MADIIKADTPIEEDAANSVMGILQKYSGNFKNVLPAHLTAKRCGMLVLNSIAVNPKLAGCTPVSFLNSVLLAANMGIEIRKNSAYLVPYGSECQLLVDYRGKMDVARRAGVGAINVELVREGDEYRYGFNRDGLDFVWRPAPPSKRGEVTGAFCSARVNGDHQITVMSLEEIEGIRRRAKSGGALDFKHYGRTVKGLSLAEIRELDVATMGFTDPYRLPWITDYDRQALKTMIHRAANYWPMSAALLISQEADTAVDTGTPMPLAEGMSDVIRAIDPADNRPMVDGGGDTFAEQKETLKRVGAAELEKSEKRRANSNHEVNTAE